MQLILLLGAICGIQTSDALLSLFFKTAEIQIIHSSTLDKNTVDIISKISFYIPWVYLRL